MPQFRLTKKYAADYRIGALLEPQNVLHPLDDWFIDVIRVKRKKIAMATHAQSVFTFFMPYAEVGGAASIPECIGILLKEFLYDQDLSEWAEQIESLFRKPAIFCKTVDKKILGHMNDFKRCVISYINYSPNGIDPINWDHLAKKVNSMPINFSEENRYIYPVEMLGSLLGYPLKLLVESARTD
jgi:hypothetical protein